VKFGDTDVKVAAGSFPVAIIVVVVVLPTPVYCQTLKSTLFQ
jgi:hypothetical protein